MKLILNLSFFFLFIFSFAQSEIDVLDQLEINEIPNNQIKRVWLKLSDDGMGEPISVPVIILKGKTTSPVLGLTAAIHGNELNGIKVIHELVDEIDISKLNGTIIAIPGLNQVAITRNQRRFIDNEDLNRSFPGKKNGNRSQQYAYQIANKVLPHLDYLIDMHTASFGRENSLYIRADMTNDTIKQMALLQDADIVLKSRGPSSGVTTNSNRTLRAEASLKGIPTITVEYGNPQVFQKTMISRGVNGVQNVLNWLDIHEFEIEKLDQAILCKNSYWVYVDQGGILEVPVELKQIVDKGAVIGILKNPFGAVIKTYYAPEKGIVIGKSLNPINMSGGRIIHLGILED